VSRPNAIALELDLAVHAQFLQRLNGLARQNYRVGLREW